MANVRCTCGERFQASFEGRRAPRFQVHCHGQLLHCESLRFLGNIMVTSVSRHGVGFTHTARFAIMAGDIYTVRFHLTPSVREPISAAVICRRVTADLIGAEGCISGGQQSGIVPLTETSLLAPAAALQSPGPVATVSPASPWRGHAP